MKKILLISLCLVLIGMLSSCRPSFKEQQVEDAVCAKVGKVPENLDKTDLENVYSLYLYDAKDVSDISKFKNLTELSITESEADVWKSLYTTQLTSLELWNNTGEVDFAQIDKSKLESLSVMGNDIINLETLSEAKNLTSLIVWNANDTDFSFVKELDKLTHLEIVNSEIEDISFVSGLKNLTGLSLGENLISDISPLKKHMGLKTLDLHHNHISDISDLRNIIDLQELNISENSVSDISPVSNLTGLININLSHNEIDDISPLANLRFLQTANISYNYISSLSAFENLSDIAEITANNNVITSVPQTLLKNAYYMDLSANNIKITNANFFLKLEQNTNSVGGINLFDNLLTKQDINALSGIASVSFLSNGLPVSAEGYAEYVSAMREITNVSSKLSQKQRAELIYTNLAERCEKAEVENVENSLGSFNVIVNGRGTSIDCAEALSSAFRRAGIKSTLYCGDKFSKGNSEMQHYWTLAEIDGKRVYCDLHCDLDYPTSPEYFGVNDEIMSKNEHIMLDDYRGAITDTLQ